MASSLFYLVCSGWGSTVLEKLAVSETFKVSRIPPLRNQSDAVIRSAEDGESNAQYGKPGFSLYLSLVQGFQGRFLPLSLSSE